MSELFNVYESNFFKATSFITKQITLNADFVSAQTNEAISEATQELSKMEIQYGMCRLSEMKGKIYRYKEQLRALKRKILEKEKVFNKEKQRLSDQSLDRQQNLGINLLLDAKRQMQQNAGLSNEVMVGVKKNNEKLQRNISRLGDVDSNLTAAKHLLGSIKLKMSKNKYILYATITALVIVIVFVVYTHFV